MSDVIDFQKRLEKSQLERGEAGVFVNCPPDVREMLTGLGHGKERAVGLMYALPAPGDPTLMGWALLPDEARELAKALIQAADECCQP